MKSIINTASKYRVLAAFVICISLLFVTACKKDDAGFADSRYLENFGISIYHVNPITGQAYTAEELAALTYNPNEEERYSEGQSVDLKLITDKKPSQVNILNGGDLSVIENVTSFTEANGKFETPNFVKTLPELGLNEIGDVMTIKYDITYEDGSIGAALFEVKKIKFIDPNALFDTFVYLQKNDGKVVPIRLESEKLTNNWSYNGPYGAIVDFNGTTDKVEVSPSTDIDFRADKDFSIGFWVKTTSTESDPSMVGDKDWGSGGNPGFVFAYKGGDWKLNVGGNGDRIDIDGGQIGDGNWHYLIATFDRDGDVKIYQDGEAKGSSSLTGLTNIASGLPIFIGQDGTGNYGDWFNGSIGQVTIFDYVLTASEITALSEPSTGVKLKKQDGTVMNVSVANSDATVEGDKGKFVYDFNGTSQYATLSESELAFRHDSDYSISFWVKTTSGDSDPVMIGDQDWNSSGNVGSTIAFKGDNWRSVICDGTNKVSENPAGSTFNDGDWHLLTVTYDRDGDMVMYQDDKAIASASMSALGATKTGNPLRLAQDGPATYGQFFQGKIANTVIYDYVLTPEQVQALSGN